MCVKPPFYADFIDYYIPDRYKEGYGISFDGIDYAEDRGISLIIALSTVSCSKSSVPGKGTGIANPA